MSYSEGKHMLAPVWVGAKLDTFAYFLQSKQLRLPYTDK